MSRIGKNPVSVPSGVSVEVDGGHITIKGAKGMLSRELSDAEVAGNRHTAQAYQRLIELHREATT